MDKAGLLDVNYIFQIAQRTVFVSVSGTLVRAARGRSKFGAIR